MPSTRTLLARDLLREAALGSVLRAFRRQGIQTLVLKGFAYLGREYARGERPCQDADLLVRPRDFRKACAVLRREGYAVRVRGEARARNGVLDIDLHDHLYGEGEARLWREAGPFEIAGAPALCLCPPHAFAYALWHGAVRHARIDGRLTEDLARIAKGGGPGFRKEAAAEIRARGLAPAAALVLPGLVCARGPGGGWAGWLQRWGVARGPKGGTGHLLMAAASRDRFRAAGRLARTVCRFLGGRARPPRYNARPNPIPEGLHAPA